MTARVLFLTPDEWAHVTRRVPCPECGGDGLMEEWSGYGTDVHDCDACDGDGTVPAAACSSTLRVPLRVNDGDEVTW